MRVNIVVTDPFPYGDAACNRIISYARELVKLGTEVNVHCLQPHVRPSQIGDNSPKPEVEGCFDGIFYQFPAKTFMWPETGANPFRKVLLRLKSYIFSFIDLFKHRKTTDIVLICTTRLFTFYFYWIVCRLLSLKYVVERSELPTIVKNAERYQKSFIGRFYIWLTKKSFKLFDGWIIETQFLADYYLPRAHKNAKHCIAPMTVEHERFTTVQRYDTPYGRYIAYCGNMREDDGVSILIEAFGLIHNKFPDVKLLLAGESSDTPKQKELAQNLSVADSVVFLGRLNRDEVPQFLKNATILALASPTSPRSCASMPCKVGEYLCTSNPVIVTSLGEIPKYLTDGVDSYLAEADSAERFAEKLEFILNEPEERRNKIGAEGKNTALKYFSSKEQGENINRFFYTLIQ